jgi:hypothetical protein
MSVSGLAAINYPTIIKTKGIKKLFCEKRLLIIKQVIHTYKIFRYSDVC